jgi:hypothetical protein
MYYPNYKGRTWNREDPAYTLVVTDMIDGIGVNDTNFGFSNSNDQVSGYTIRQLEDALVGVKTWNQWRDKIKSMYNNPSENNLDKLFKAYE